MKIRAYELGDERYIPAQVNDWHRDIMAGLALVGKTLTVEHNGQVVVVMGLAKLWPGVADCWSLVHPQSGATALQLVRVVRSSLESFAVVEDLRRANAMAGDDRQLRWMRCLGFEHEYTQRRAGPKGEDLHGMVKWFKGADDERLS